MLLNLMCITLSLCSFVFVYKYTYLLTYLLNYLTSFAILLKYIFLDSHLDLVLHTTLYYITRHHSHRVSVRV